MTKGLRTLAAAALLTVAGSAFAGTVSPDNVKIVDMQIAASLTGKSGDAVTGREVFANRKLGNCLACHANQDLNNELFHGEVGPPLDGVADRWSEAELRAILVNSKQIFGDQTIMPGFYTLDLGARIVDKQAGKTILSAEQVEDVISYLTTLTE